MRFARIREEKRHNYVTKCCELSVANFISDDRPNVKGIVIAGSANLKYDLQNHDKWDKRLANIVLGSLDVSYGFENGLSQAITLGADLLSNVKFVHEKKIIGKFFEAISLDTGLITFGVDDTMKALELGALETMLLFEEIEIMRYEIKNPVKQETKVYLLTAAQE